MNNTLQQLAINTIRTLSIDAVQKAKSGHPGMPMGAAPMAYTLWMQHLKHNPKNPEWYNRDRFILSAGHGSMLLYSLLHLTGYNVSLEDLKKFRQWKSKTPGHPEYKHTEGVEITTGPLGQGFATGVGMAIAQKYLSERYNKEQYKIIDYKIYGIVSDGDLMEGVASEAASLAGHLQLNNIIYLYDDNKISIDGNTELSFTENVQQRFESYGWNVQVIEDGNDIQKISQAIEQAKKSSSPTLIKVRTHIGYGSPNKQDTAEAHGSPLGEDEIKLAKKNYGWDTEKTFFVPDEVQQHFHQAIEKGKLYEQEWNALFTQYKKHYPELAQELFNLSQGIINDSWKKHLPTFTSENGNLSTRESSGKILSAIAPHIPTLIGGSADLTPSNNTKVKDFSSLQKNNFSGRYIHFGVREHAMGAILNGIALTKGMISYGGTFLIFSEYMRPPIRLAALMQIRPIYVFTHDSIGLGEDGPTHQPIEQLASLRSIPNILVLRPADANEVVETWKIALEHTTGPVALILTRQKVSFVDRTKYALAENVSKGAYILAENNSAPEIILVGTGSEVQLVLQAYEQIIKDGIKARVVSMPSWELFEYQPKEYREKIFPKNIFKRIIVEAGSPFGWHKYAGSDGVIIGMETFGASAPAEILMKEFGFTVENIVKKIKEIM